MHQIHERVSSVRFYIIAQAGTDYGILPNSQSGHQCSSSTTDSFCRSVSTAQTAAVSTYQTWRRWNHLLLSCVIPPNTTVPPRLKKNSEKCLVRTISNHRIMMLLSNAEVVNFSTLLLRYCYSGLGLGLFARFRRVDITSCVATSLDDFINLSWHECRLWRERGQPISGAGALQEGRRCHPTWISLSCEKKLHSTQCHAPYWGGGWWIVLQPALIKNNPLSANIVL